MTSRPLLSGASHDVGRHAVGADDDRGALLDVVEAVDAADALVAQLGDDALVVDDLAERMGRLAGGRGDAGGVDRLADPVAEAGPARDADLVDVSHVGSSIAPGRVGAIGRVGLRELVAARPTARPRASSERNDERGGPFRCLASSPSSIRSSGGAG